MISVAIPAYKKKYLEQAIKSVLNQSYSDFELIIVDDYSPEDLSSTVNKFSDLRVHYYRNKINLGSESLVKNWNKCLEYCKGEYFVLFSDDDIMEPNFLANLFGLSQKYPQVDLFHSRVKKINAVGDVIGYTPLCPEYESVVDFLWHAIYGYRNLFVTEFLCRTDAIKAIGGFVDFPLAWGSDYATWFTLAKKNGIVYSDESLSSWRFSDSNISSIGNIEKRLSALYQYEQWLNTFVDNLSVINEKEIFLVEQCKSKINSFFRQKREYLLFQQLTKKDKIKGIFNLYKDIKKFKLDTKSAYIQYAKTLFS